MTARGAAASILLALLLASCGGDGGRLAPGPSGPAPPVTTVAGSTPTTATDALATFSRTGGLDGRRFEVVVLNDGTFLGGTGAPSRGSLGADSLRQLRELVKAFAATAPRPAYGSAVPDGFVRSVSAGGATTEVHTEADVPPAVAQLLGFLSGLERQLPR